MGKVYNSIYGKSIYMGEDTGHLRRLIVAICSLAKSHIETTFLRLLGFPC